MMDEMEGLLSKAVDFALKYERIAGNKRETFMENYVEQQIRCLEKEAEKENHVLSLPFAAMVDTCYGKKANYGQFVKDWKTSSYLHHGWALLILADTLEQMAEAIYEWYQELAVLLCQNIEQYFHGMEKQRRTDKKEEQTGTRKMDRALAALAVLKACRMEVIPCDKYAAKAKRMFEENKESSCGTLLNSVAEGIWKELRKLWGEELELPVLEDYAGKDDEKSVSILHKTARSVVLELPGEDIYYTEAYEIWVNGVFVRNDHHMVITIGGLCPKTRQKIEIKRNGTILTIVTETEEEYVTLNVRRFGARGDGNADDTIAIQTAIMSCPKHSRVYIPAGVYRIRNLFLKSDIVLELGKGAILQGFQQREEFPVLPGHIKTCDGQGEYILGTWEGNPLTSMASLINGIDVENVVICGEGTVDGGGNFETWWVKEKNGYPPYRPKMFFFNRCKNMTIQGIHLKNSPSWNIHPFFSEKIRIYNITLESPDLSHNTDGIDPESCEDVEIAGVHFSVGDDCIAIKSGKIYMGNQYRIPSRDICIRQCLMEKGHGAVTIGSEISGGVYGVTVTKCLFLDTDRGLRIKTRRGRGMHSIVDGISFDQIRMERVKSPFVVNCFYFCDPDGMSDYVASQKPLPLDERTPQIKKLRFSNIVCCDAHYTGVCIYGLPEQKVEEVEMDTVTISFAANAEAGIAAMMRECVPTCRQGVFIKNVKKVIWNKVSLEGAAEKEHWEGVDERIVN